MRTIQTFKSNVRNQSSFPTILLNLKMSDPIASFFAGHPDFTYRPSQTDDWRQIKAFNALATELNWPQYRRELEYEKLKAEGIKPDLMSGIKPDLTPGPTPRPNSKPARLSISRRRRPHPA